MAVERGDGDERVGRIVEACAGAYVRGEGSVGLAVGVVAAGEGKCFCFGRASIGGEAVGEGTLFEIGSITKALTTVLLAEMSLKGEVGLDDPVNKYLPERGRVSGWCGERVTLRHLATHASGLPRLPPNLRMDEIFGDDPYGDYTVEELYECLRTWELGRRPGVQYEYSNFGAGLLGHVLGLAAGKDYDELVREQVCGPLGMVDTAVTLSAEQAGRLAAGHADGRPKRAWSHRALAGAVGMRSSVGDMVRFVAANLSPEGTPLAGALRLSQWVETEEGKEEGRWPRVVAAMALLAVGVGVAVNPFGWPKWVGVGMCLAGAVLALGDGPGAPARRTALGWMVDSLPRGGRWVFWHNGRTRGQASFVCFSPEAGVGVVVLSNCADSVDGVGVRVFERVVEGGGEHRRGLGRT